MQELLSKNCEKQAIVILRDVSFENLRALVDFVYRGEVNVPQGQLSEFLRTTESLQIKGTLFHNFASSDWSLQCSIFRKGLASYYLTNESRQQPITEPTRQMCQMRPENISDADHSSSAEATTSLVQQSAGAAKVVLSPQVTFSFAMQVGKWKLDAYFHQVPSEEQNNDEHLGTESQEDRVPVPRSPSGEFQNHYSVLWPQWTLSSCICLGHESSTSNDVAGPSALNGSRGAVRGRPHHNHSSLWMLPRFWDQLLGCSVVVVSSSTVLSQIDSFGVEHWADFEER